MKQFSDLGLAEPILRAIAAEGYNHPTPIQAQVIPAMSAGRDIVGIAQTGTGKTASFVLPLLDRLAKKIGKARPAPRHCHALILVPTRELAAQINDAVRTYGRHVRPSLALVVGGAKPGPQVRALAAGADIVVATPGRLEDHLRAGAVKLDRTQAVVLDEADQMLDMGFIPAIRRILAKLPAQRQTVLMSATMPPPIRALAAQFLNAPQEIAVAPASRPIERIDQRVIHVAAADKRRTLTDVLRGTDVARAIVFTRTKRGADKISEHLEKAGLAAAAIHGNKSQGQRERALAAFRQGRSRILVATDIAARGIDIDDVTHVVNFELPYVAESYVHRIGRTARAGRAGTAISLCDGSERGLLRDIERLIGRSLPASGEVQAASERPGKPGARPKSGQPQQRRRRNRAANASGSGKARHRHGMERAAAV
ncbi:MAG: DEAD/DEAH box helicase [Sphingomonadales bacterium]